MRFDKIKANKLLLYYLCNANIFSSTKQPWAASGLAPWGCVSCSWGWLLPLYRALLLVWLRFLHPVPAWSSITSAPGSGWQAAERELRACFPVILFLEGGIKLVLKWSQGGWQSSVVLIRPFGDLRVSEPFQENGFSIEGFPDILSHVKACCRGVLSNPSTFKQNDDRLAQWEVDDYLAHVLNIKFSCDLNMIII